jgi:uncharacterized protein (DUF58 family)
LTRRQRRAARGDAGSFPTPRHAFGPVAGSVLTVVTWGAIAHSSGSGWVQAMGALLGAFLLVALVVPAFATRRARVRVLGCPADVTAGQPAELTVEVSAPMQIRALRPRGKATVSGAGSVCTVRVEPERRGVLETCTVEVASAAPLGLLWWRKRVTVALPRPLVVAPRMGEPDQAALSASDRQGEDERRVPARVGEPRGVRPYRPGDLRHWVHWPATAHTGSLMVREMEAPASRPVVVRAALPPDPAEAEHRAERALGTVAALLGRGRAVVLETVEADGPHHEPVPDVRSAGRRLARAR